MYSYFRKGCRKAYAPIPLGILGVYACVLIERQPFLNKTHGASVHFGVVVVELINCKCGGIVRNQIW